MTRVALIGANGHGTKHRDRVLRLDGFELVGLCDVAPVVDPPKGVPIFTDHAGMLKAVQPEVVIVCTPPATHCPFALTALEAGADVLLEKPPVLDLAEHDRLESAIAQTGRAVQVGFQALASPELPRLKLLTPCDVSVLGAWHRPDGYWVRSPWAGRLPLDGALRNPFAHALMQALAVASSPPVRVEVAWCRVRAGIEVDDTATLRVTLANGKRVLIAVTLAAPEAEFIDGEMRVRDTTLSFRAFEAPTLLENLVAHRLSGEPLLAPLRVTRDFTAVIQALSGMPLPGLVPGGTFGVTAALRRCVDEYALLNEIDIPWAANVTGGTANIAY